MSLKAEIHKTTGSFKLDIELNSTDLITGVLGPSGCGKSMTLKCIAGIMTPDEGHIELDGRVLYDSASHVNVRPQERHVGYLFQNYALFPTMNVRKNIMCGLKREKDRAVKEEKYRYFINLLGLEGLEDLKPWQLSGGQAQRTALARILVNSPDLLLLDEPFSALDSFMRRSLQENITEILTAIGKQTIMVTHSQREARRMCTKLLVMDKGNVIRIGSTEDVFANPGSERCALLLEE